MLFTEFNMEDALEVRYEEGFEDGMEKGELIKLIRTAVKRNDPESTPEQIYETFLSGK